MLVYCVYASPVFHLCLDEHCCFGFYTFFYLSLLSCFLRVVFVGVVWMSIVAVVAFDKCLAVGVLFLVEPACVRAFALCTLT